MWGEAEMEMCYLKKETGGRSDPEPARGLELAAFGKSPLLITPVLRFWN